MQKRRAEGQYYPHFFLATVVGFLFSFRVMSLPLLIASVALAHRLGPRSRWTTALRGAFLISLLSPVDIPALGRYRDGGAHHSGLRLVRCVVGLPMHTSLIARYGEYYWLGCSGYTANNPRWVLVLR